MPQRHIIQWLHKMAALRPGPSFLFSRSLLYSLHGPVLQRHIWNPGSPTQSLNVLISNLNKPHKNVYIYFYILLYHWYLPWNFLLSIYNWCYITFITLLWKLDKIYIRWRLIIFLVWIHRLIKEQIKNKYVCNNK